MSIEAIVKRRRKTRKGRGFSREELRQVDLSFTEALKLGIPIDTRRSTKHQENVEKLKDYVKKLKLELPTRQEEAETIELAEVKGIGPRTAEKLKEAGIENANQLAGSSPPVVAGAIGSSEERAISFIGEARSLLGRS
jgi:replicative superfamily II helicase